MALAARFGVLPLTFTDGSTTVVVDQIISTRITPGSRKHIVTPGGALDRGAVADGKSEPILGFSTHDLKTLLDDVSPTVGFDASSGGHLNHQKRLEGGAYSSGSDHEKYTFTDAFVYLNSIAASDGDRESGVVLDGTIMPFSSDGQASPLALAAAAVANAAAFNQTYLFGPIYYNSAAVDGVTGVRIDFGITVRSFWGNGARYPKSCAIIAREPRVSFQVVDLAWFRGQVASLFGGAPGNAFNVYFQNKNVAYGTASHVKITIGTGYDWTPEEISVSGNEDANVTINLLPTGTLSVSTGSAIP